MLVCDASGYGFEPHLAPYIPKNMEGIDKKYTLVRIDQLRVNDKLKAELVYGDIGGYYDCLEYPQTKFDSEEEAFNYLLQNRETMWGDWIVVPIYSVNYY